MSEKQTESWIPPHLAFLLRVYGLGIVVFTAFRLLLLLLHVHRINGLQKPVPALIQSFLIGWRFDTVVSAYLLAVPFLVLSVLVLREHIPRGSIQLVRLILSSGYVLAFFICCVDIPYFNHYNSRLTTGLFNWIDTPLFMLKIVAADVVYWVFIIPFIFTSWLFWRFINRQCDRFFPQSRRNPDFSIGKTALFSLLGIILLFVGIRGRLDEKSPIRAGTAYFSNNTFANLLALNPVFTFAQSVLNRFDHDVDHPLMQTHRALRLVKQYLGIPRMSDYRSPLARSVRPSEKPIKRNVVLVIMESMAAWKTGHFGNQMKLTPNLDSLMRHSYCFNRIYTSGVHTYSGVFSTLFGFPVYMDIHPLNHVPIRSYWGLPNILHSFGYRTVFFLTHDDQFDNLGGFLRANGIDRVVSKIDYPSSEVRSTLGVPDHVMFDRALSELDAFYAAGESFLAVLLTASDHRPFIIPENIPFTPDSLPRHQQIVQYADWAIGRFVDKIQHRPWYQSSLLVFVADTGALSDGLYDMPLSMHHTPLIIHGPGITDQPRAFNRIGGQIDVFPTVLGMLNLPYVNNSLGIDLLRKRRHWIFFSSDDKLGCLGAKWYLVVRETGHQSLYHYNARDTRDVASLFPDKVRRMHNYLMAMLSVSRLMEASDSVGYPARRVAD